MNTSRYTSVVLVAAFLPTTSTYAIEARDTSYFCGVEFSAGLAFSKSTKKWKSAKLRPTRKFVLRLKFLASGIRKDRLGNDESAGDFNVTVTDAGSDNPTPCYPSQPEKYSITTKLDDPWFSCSAGLYDFNINLGKNRFLAASLVGYVNGQDVTGDTPTVSGGTCTKIE
jgi:hypothetical protein